MLGSWASPFLITDSSLNTQLADAKLAHISGVGESVCVSLRDILIIFSSWYMLYDFCLVCDVHPSAVLWETLWFVLSYISSSLGC